MKSWGEETLSPSGWLELETRQCDAEIDLNNKDGTNDNSNFSKVSEGWFSGIFKYYKRLKCFVNRDDMMIRGNYNTVSAANIVAAFEKCDPSTSAVTCRSEEEIMDWLEHKYLIIYFNDKQFVAHKFEEERINAVSKMVWLPLATQSRVDFVYHITRTTVMLNDHHFNIGTLMEDHEKGWQMDR